MSIICPYCKQKLMTVNYKSQGTYDGIDFEPDESETGYGCPECEEELDAELVADL